MRWHYHIAIICSFEACAATNPSPLDISHAAKATDVCPGAQDDDNSNDGPTPIECDKTIRLSANCVRDDLLKQFIPIVKKLARTHPTLTLTEPLGPRDPELYVRNDFRDPTHVIVIDDDRVAHYPFLQTDCDDNLMKYGLTGGLSLAWTELVVLMQQLECVARE